MHGNRRRRAAVRIASVRAARDRELGACSGSGAWWGHRGGAPIGVNHRRFPNAYSAARLRCRDLLLRRARVAAGRRPREIAGLDRVERKVVKLVNRIRTHHGLRQLRASRTLAHAASVHTGDMLRADFFSHDSTDGTPMATRVRRSPAHLVGENIAVTTRRRGVARRVVRMWMDSPPHRAVLLSPRAAASASASERGRLGSAAYAVFTADFASSR